MVEVFPKLLELIGRHALTWWLRYSKPIRNWNWWISCFNIMRKYIKIVGTNWMTCLNIMVKVCKGLLEQLGSHALSRKHYNGLGTLNWICVITSQWCLSRVTGTNWKSCLKIMTAFSKEVMPSHSHYDDILRRLQELIGSHALTLLW